MYQPVKAPALALILLLLGTTINGSLIPRDGPYNTSVIFDNSPATRQLLQSCWSCVWGVFTSGCIVEPFVAALEHCGPFLWAGSVIVCLLEILRLTPKCTELNKKCLEMGC